MAKNELTVPMNQEKAVALGGNFPQEVGFTRTFLPRLAFKSQDVMEGVGKNKKVIIEAGTFFLEKQTDEENPETGKKVWSSDELGTEIEGVILYQRKQLSFYDESTSSYISTPIYDNDDDILPLFSSGAEIERATPVELKAKYPAVTMKGKPTSSLKDNRVLYVLLNGELTQLTVHGTSMYSYMDYAKKVRPAVPAVLTAFNSEPKENGSTAWNQMTFVAKRPLSDKEADIVLEMQQEIIGGINQEKAYYAGQTVDPLQGEMDKR